MSVQENRLITASALVTVATLLALGLFEARFGVFGEWVYVLAYLLWIVLAYAIPQALLMKRDPAISQTSRLGVITLMMIILLPTFARNVSGMQGTVLWAILGLSIGAIFAHEIRNGYIESITAESS